MTTLGTYLATYWVLGGRFRDNTDWATRQVHWLHRNGRMFPERDHIHTLLYTYDGADAVADSGAGVVRWASPFIPTVPGTDRYTDQLW